MAVVGSAHILVKAITTGFQKDVRQALKDMRPALEKEGEQSAKSFSKGFKDQSKKSLENFKPLTGTKDNFEQSGASSAKSFTKGFKAQSKESLKNFNPFIGKSSDFRDAGSSAGRSFGVGLKQEIRASLADLDSVFDRGGKRAGKAFNQSFKEQTRDGLSTFDPLRGTGSVYGEAGRRASRAFTADFKKDIKLALKDLEDDFYKSGSKAGTRFQQGFRDQTKSFKKYFSGLFDRDGGEGRVGRFLSSLTGGFGNFRQAALRANDAFFTLVTTGYLIGPLIGQLVSSISALVSGLFALGSSVASAIPSLIVLPGIFAAIGQAALTLKLAFSGIGEAVKQYSNATGGATDNTKRVEQAERRLAQVLESNRERLAAADRTLERAERDLTEARIEAAESLQQLNFDAEDAAISEQKAAIQLEKARETLARVQDLPPNSRARREAELAYAEADLNLRRAKDRNADLAAETEEANRKGVEGSDQVVAATERVQDAIDAKAKAERDALRSQIDAEEALEDARKGSGGAGSQALDKLSEEAKRFAQFIANTVIPALDKLKQAAGAELFGPLEIALQNIVDKLFPRLEGILRKTGAALGEAAIELSEFITSADNLDRLEKLGDTNVYVIENLGTIFGNLYESMLILLNAADPLIRRFTDWIVTLTTGWTESLRLKEETGELTDMFNRSGDVAAQLGRIFGNIWEALMNIGRAASGPGSGGQMLLDMFENSTARFAEFTAEISENGKLQEYFVNVAENFGEISRALVEITAAFLRLADNPAIGKFWGDLADSDIPGLFEKIFDVLTEASVYLIPFGEQLLRVIEVFTETGSIQKFFEILTVALKNVADFFNQPIVKQVMLQVAAFLGAVKALTLLSKIGAFIGKVVAGYFFKFAGMIGKVGTAITGLGTMATGKAGLGAFLAGGAIVVGIAAVTALFVGLWTQSEKFREAIKQLGRVIYDTLIVAFNRIKEALNEALEPLGGTQGAWEGLKTILKAVGDFLADYIIPIIQEYLVFAITRATEVIALFIGIVSGIIQVFQGVWEFVQGIFALFRGDMDAVSEHFSAAWDKIKSAIETVITFVYDFFVNMFQAILDFLLPWDVDVRAIFSAIGDFISDVWNKIKIVFDPIWDGIKTAFSIGIGAIKLLFEGLGIAWDVMSTALQTVFDTVIEPLVIAPFELAIKGVKTAIDTIKTAFNLLKIGMKSAYQNVIEPYVISPFEAAIGVVKTAIDGIKTAFDAVKTGMEKAWEIISGILSSLKDAADKALGPLDEIVGFAGSAVSTVGGWFGFAEGGLVTKPTLGLVGEAGPEVIIPLSANKANRREELLRQSGLKSSNSGGAGVVINMTVNPSAGMSESDLASAVSRELAFQLRKGAMR